MNHEPEQCGFVKAIVLQARVHHLTTLEISGQSTFAQALNQLLIKLLQTCSNLSQMALKCYFIRLIIIAHS